MIDQLRQNLALIQEVVHHGIPYRDQYKMRRLSELGLHRGDYLVDHLMTIEDCRFFLWILENT